MKFFLLKKYWYYFSLGLLLFWIGGAAFLYTGNLDEKNVDWPNYGGDPAGSRYSELSQINLQNVKNLQLAWSYDTGENKPDDARKLVIPCQPIVVNGVMYGTTPQLKLFAANAATGQELWKFDPFADPNVKPNFQPVRGVVYWAEGNDERILYSVGATLYAINAQTGEPIESFGKNGGTDLHAGLGDEATLGYDVNQYSIRSTTPGVIYKNLIIMGSALNEGGNAPPGHIRAFDVRTGKLAWVFRTIPLPGEYGYETWEKDSYKKLGGANCWAGMVIDEKRGMVFMGTGSPSSDFYGGARKGSNLFANCVIALNAETGKRIWHFQTVHHDLWDRDIPCPPNLITVKAQQQNHRGRGAGYQRWVHFCIRPGYGQAAVSGEGGTRTQRAHSPRRAALAHPARTHQTRPFCQSKSDQSRLNPTHARRLTPTCWIALSIAAAAPKTCHPIWKVPLCTAWAVEPSGAVPPLIPRASCTSMATTCFGG